ncbi:MAG: SAM hydrolase/SAM-dependent halogenase family protein [Opitutales bacterium]
MASPLALLTDFGTTDWYVGVMKGVIAGIAPEAACHDLTHALPQGDIRSARFALRQSLPWFPEGTVFLVVVDPGVGTHRRPLAVALGGHYLVGPDNGLFPELTGEKPVFREITHPTCRFPEMSRTFHGRDLFAPTAARLAAGLAFAETGPEINDPVTLPEDTGGTPFIQYIDRFGNAITTLPAAAAEPVSAVWINGKRIPFADTYGDVEPGAALLTVGSTGFLEIAVRNGSAADWLDLKVGDTVGPEGDQTQA